MGKAEEIASLLKEKILSGAFQEKLPSEKELARNFDVAPNTAGKAVRLLAGEGIVVRVHGSGTFVKHPEKRLVKVLAFDYVFNILQEACRSEFPEIRLEQVSKMECADIITITSFFPFEYQRYLDAMPEGIFDAVANDCRFYPECLKIHKRGNVCYGVPVFFSPVIYAYNKKLMTEIAPDFSPYAVTIDSLLKLLQKAACRGFGGIDASSFTRNSLTSLIANFQGEITWELLQKSFALLDQILPFISKESFNDGKVLFKLISRQALSLNYISKDIAFDLMPSPGFAAGERRCDIASEALGVNLQSPGKEVLWKIVLLTLKSEFQKRIAAKRCGIPLDRTLAVETLDSTRYRDDIFFGEIKNLDFTRSRIPLPVMREISLEYGNVLGGTLAPEAFYEHIRKTFEQYEYEKSRNRKCRF